MVAEIAAEIVVAAFEIVFAVVVDTAAASYIVAVSTVAVFATALVRTASSENQSLYLDKMVNQSETAGSPSQTVTEKGAKTGY